MFYKVLYSHTHHHPTRHLLPTPDSPHRRSGNLVFDARKTVRIDALGMLLGTQHSKLHFLFVFSKRVYTHFPRDPTWGPIYAPEKMETSINEIVTNLLISCRKTVRMETLEMLLGPQHSKLHSIFVFSKRVYTHFPHDTTWGSILTPEKRERKSR